MRDHVWEMTWVDPRYPRRPELWPNAAPEMRTQVDLHVGPSPVRKGVEQVTAGWLVGRVSLDDVFWV